MSEKISVLDKNDNETEVIHRTVYSDPAERFYYVRYNSRYYEVKRDPSGWFLRPYFAMSEMELAKRIAKSSGRRSKRRKAKKNPGMKKNPGGFLGIPLMWWLIGGGAVAAYFLFKKKAVATTTTPSLPAQTTTPSLPAQTVAPSAPGATTGTATPQLKELMGWYY